MFLIHLKELALKSHLLVNYTTLVMSYGFDSLKRTGLLRVGESEAQPNTFLTFSVVNPHEVLCINI